MSKSAVIGVIVVVIVLVGGGILLANRGGSDDKNNTSTASSSNKESSSSNNASSSQPTTTNAVSIANFAFSPADITVTKGTTVTWTNNDSTAHTVTETDSLSGPKSEEIAPGKTFTFTFDTAGTYHYHCSIHSSMTGTVTVT